MGDAAVEHAVKGLFKTIDFAFGQHRGAAIATVSAKAPRIAF
jgi:hypothetical protein